jgi:predicted glycoside hydrolase/deacetylase ChbG (UPF0249 family)
LEDFMTPREMLRLVQADDLPAGMYRDERALELEVLCDPGARSSLTRHGVELRSFAELPAR